MSATSLKADAQLSALIREFTVRIQNRSAKLIKDNSELEQKLRVAGQAADRVSVNFAGVRCHRPISYQIDDCEVEGRHNRCTTVIDVASKPVASATQTFGRNNSSFSHLPHESEMSMEDEEKVAISQGIEALKYFFHHSKSSPEYYAADHYFELEEDDENSPQSDDSAEADIFNRRPLPFIIGSKDFMESEDGGIGSEQDVDSSSRSGQ